MANWRWYHVVLLWIGGIVVAAALLTLFGSAFRANATSSSGGLVSIGAPLWIAVLLLVLLIALVIATATWLRAR